MTTYEPHPYSIIFPAMKDDDFDKLVADIKANGLRQQIVMYQDKILDGNNRYRACGVAKIEPTFVEFKGNDAQARALVISANIHRRHLTPAQKRDMLQMLILIDPTKSNRQIGEAAKVSHQAMCGVSWKQLGRLPSWKPRPALMARSESGRAANPRAAVAVRATRPSLTKKWLMAKPPVMPTTFLRSTC
jgi:hypothetical protein